MPQRNRAEQLVDDRRASTSRRFPTGDTSIDEARSRVARLEEEHVDASEVAEEQLQQLRESNGGQLPDDPKTVERVTRLFGRVDAVAAQLEAARSDLLALHEHRNGTSRFGDGAAGSAARWAAATAEALGNLTPQAGVVSGSIDTPSLVETGIVADPHNATRLIDLLIDRRPIENNSFEFLRQTVRTNNAAPVADSGTKPTSVFTVKSIEDRARVVAHLSEPVPIRLFADHDQLQGWLASELANGVLDNLEDQAVTGDGTGENFTGLTNTTGVTTVAFDTDILTSLRKGRTIMQDLSEDPTAWVLSTADAQSIDLQRDSSGLFVANGGLANIFGPHPIVVSTSLTAGTALLADWRLARLYVREGIRVDVDAGGALFDTNEAKLRGEGRFGVAYLRPQAFAVIDTAA